MSKLKHSALTLLCILSAMIPSALQAQTSVSRSVTAVESVSFRPHLYLQPQAGLGFTIGEGSARHLISPAAALSLGYRFTPAFSLRAGASGWQARGAWLAHDRRYKFGYMQGNIDAMLSFTGLTCGFNPRRVIDFYGFAGAGLACGFHNNDAVRFYDEGLRFEKLWTGKTIFPALRFGLGLDFNLSNSFAINLEVNANMLPDKFNSKQGSSVDWHYNALVGVKYSFGGRSRKTVTRTEEIVEETVAPMPAPTPAPAPKQVEDKDMPVAKPDPMTQDIFFRINSSVISQAEQTKVDALAAYLKANPEATVTITGYADRATGYPAYNLKLSAARADRVAAALKAAGIDQSRITVDAKGDTVQPFGTPRQNRVAIAVAQ